MEKSLRKLRKIFVKTGKNGVFSGDFILPQKKFGKQLEQSQICHPYVRFYQFKKMPKKDIICLCMLCNNIGNLYNFVVELLFKHHKKRGFSGCKAVSRHFGGMPPKNGKCAFEVKNGVFILKNLRDT